MIMCMSYLDVICELTIILVCRVEDVEQLSDVWTGALKKPNKFLKNIRDLGGGLSLPFAGKFSSNRTLL